MHAEDRDDDDPRSDLPSIEPVLRRPAITSGTVGEGRDRYEFRMVGGVEIEEHEPKPAPGRTLF